MKLHDPSKTKSAIIPQITQEIQLARQVLLLAATEELDLQSLRDTQECSRPESGLLFLQDLWQNIWHTIEPQVNKSLLRNMYTFGRKGCENPLDKVYSLLTISANGAKLPVEYGISKSQLAHNVFTFLGDNLCLEYAKKVLEILEMTGSEDCLLSQTPVDFKAQRYLHPFPKSQESFVCPVCQESVHPGYRKRPFDKVAKGHSTYVFCMRRPTAHCDYFWGHTLQSYSESFGDSGFYFIHKEVKNSSSVVVIDNECVDPEAHITPVTLRIPLDVLCRVNSNDLGYSGFI